MTTQSEPSTQYSISELAGEFALTPRAIRFYEDQGLLSPSRSGANSRNRVYSQRDRTRLKLTLRGKRLGLSIQEIKNLVDMYDSPKDTVPQLKEFLSVLAAHKTALQQQALDLAAMMDELTAHEKQCRALLKKA